jgi:hypothetical protein
MHGAPHRDLTHLLPLVLHPPGAVFQHGGVRLRLQPRQEDRVLLAADLARAAGNGLALHRAGLLLPGDVAPHRGHTHAKAPGGFSQGPTFRHHPDDALTQVS